MSFTDAQKDSKSVLALSLLTRLIQEGWGGKRSGQPEAVVLWPAFDSVADARREIDRIAFYVGSHASALRYAVTTGEPIVGAPGATVSTDELNGLSRWNASLVLVWKYEGLGEFPLRSLRRVRIVDPSFHDKCEALTAARLNRWDLTPAADSRKLDELSVERLQRFALTMTGPAAVFGTGPGLDLFGATNVRQYPTRVGCNSMVVSDEVLARTQPNVICFGDPVFHFGHSRQSVEFQDALLAYVERANPWVFLPLEFGGWVDELTYDNDRVIPLRKKRRGPFNIPSADAPFRLVTGNVLTELMVPVAAAVSDELHVYGCDGRPPEADRFWDYGTGVHDEDRYATAVSAHPSFFRDRRYLRYYEEHCDRLEAMLSQFESTGITIVNRSPSQVLALQTRSELVIDDASPTSTIDLSSETSPTEERS